MRSEEIWPNRRRETLPNVVDRASALSVADKLKRALNLPFEIQGLRLNIEASIGIAFFPDHAGDVTTLIQRADVAMYEAKTAKTFKVIDGVRYRWGSELLSPMWRCLCTETYAQQCRAREQLQNPNAPEPFHVQLHLRL